jgi:transcriptional regulator GlxA family with amidase domain
MPTKFVFLVLPHLHLLDLAGPDQVIHEAIGFGADFTIEYCGIGLEVCTSAGLAIAKQVHYTKIKFSENDFLIIPGASVKYIQSSDFKKNKDLFNWIYNCYQSKINIVSICVGAFVLGYAGLLSNINCTTHFQLTDELQQNFPNALVKENVLFQIDKNIYTSAGIVSGIDLLLHIIEGLTSNYLAHKVARELVVYNRREGTSPQNSIFLQFRNHIHNGVHKVQDYIIENTHLPLPISDLAEVANMSERNFTRLFKQETGCTVNEYKTIIRVEKIKSLIKNPNLSRSQIAQKVGLRSEKQLLRIVKNILG